MQLTEVITVFMGRSGASRYTRTLRDILFSSSSKLIIILEVIYLSN